MAILKTVGRIAGTLWDAGAGIAVASIEAKDIEVTQPLKMRKGRNSSPDKSSNTHGKRGQVFPIGRSSRQVVAIIPPPCEIPLPCVDLKDPTRGRNPYTGPQMIKTAPIEVPSDKIYIDSSGLVVNKGSYGNIN